MFKYGFCPLNDNQDNQDGPQNGRHLSVCPCGHSNLVIYHLISSQFHILTIFFNLSPKLEYEFCLINDNQDGYQNGYPLFVAVHYAVAFV